MKKVLLTLAAVVMAFAMNAQEDGAAKKFVLSGIVGLNTTSNAYTYDGVDYVNDDFNTSSLILNIVPRLGYQVSDKFQAGVFVGYTSRTWIDYRSEANIHPSVSTTATTADNSELAATRDVTISGFRFGAYGRYNLVDFNKLTLFAEMQVGVFTGTEKSVVTIEKPVGAELAEDIQNDVSNFNFNVTIVPGLNYAVNDNLSIDLYLNLIGLTFASTKSTDHQAANLGTAANPDYKEDVTVTNNFGLNCDLRNNTINDYLGGISVGISYRF